MTSKNASPSKFPFLFFHLFYGISTGYIHGIITKYEPVRSLKSVGTFTTILTVPRTHHSWGHRSFYNAASELWNNLPFHLRQQQSLSWFKSSALKTHLFFLNCIYVPRASCVADTGALFIIIIIIIKHRLPLKLSLRFHALLMVTILSLF